MFILVCHAKAEFDLKAALCQNACNAYITSICNAKSDKEASVMSLYYTIFRGKLRIKLQTKMSNQYTGVHSCIK